MGGGQKCGLERGGFILEINYFYENKKGKRDVQAQRVMKCFSNGWYCHVEKDEFFGAWRRRRRQRDRKDGEPREGQKVVKALHQHRPSKKGISLKLFMTYNGT